MSEKSIPSAISRIRARHPALTLNASAEVLARKYDFSVQKFFSPKDREVFKSIEIEKVKIKSRERGKNRKVTVIAHYDSKDTMLKRHLDEINKTYSSGCYTSTFIVCRKVLENLLIRHILIGKYPPKLLENRAKYLDDKGRFLAFSKILSNLRDSSPDFRYNKELVERIADLSEGFKDDANNMTHSWYHIAKKQEIDEKDFQQILDLIADLEKNMV
jgi:translation initiation factor 1 (eIF-1/SUI1)